MRRQEITVTTSADGSATAYSPRLSGLIHQMHYIKVDFADGVDFAITSEKTGQSLWTESNVNAAAVKAPRQPTHTQAGVAATLDGTVAALEPIGIANDRIKIVIAAGGNAKSGTFHFLIG
jgi:hypothetical protein